MHLIRREETPSLHDAVLVMAFSGWNDAADAATRAIEFLCRQVGGCPFASLDPEEFYDFANQRPHVRFTPEEEREIVWPANQFWYVVARAPARDLVIGLGVEPHLKWRAYVAAILDVVRQCQVSLVVTLGAFLAEALYSRPVRVIGTATDPDLSVRLGLAGSRYEGPTGIVGVLNDACRKEGVSTISLWATIPHYLQGIPNPKAAMALLEHFSRLLNWTMDLTELETEAATFDARVAEAIAGNSALTAYIRRLEEKEKEAEAGSEETEDLPTGEALAEELERFLREQREQKDGEA